MTSDCRNLKMAAIASLIFGLITVGVGIFYIITSPTVTQSYVCAIDGAALTYMGFTAARRINVPSNAPAIRNMCSIVVLIAFVCAAFLMLNHAKLIMQVIIGSLGLVLSLICFVIARKITNIQKAQ